MAVSNTDPAQMARAYFVAVGLSVIAFVIAVLLLVGDMPSNEGEPAPITTLQHMASKQHGPHARAVNTTSTGER